MEKGWSSCSIDNRLDGSMNAGKKEFVYIVTHLKRKKETRGVCLFVALPDPYNLVNEAN